MSKRKPSGLWWKSLVSGIVLAFLAVVVGFLTAIKEKPEGRLYVSFNTGQEVTFELKEGVTMWLEETNRGLGSSPGRIENAEETVRLYGPDGQQIPFSDDQLGDGGYSEGTFVAPGNISWLPIRSVRRSRAAVSGEDVLIRSIARFVMSAFSTFCHLDLGWFCWGSFLGLFA